MLEELMKMLKEQESKQIPVAKLTPELKKAHKKFIKEKERLHEEIEARMEELAIQSKRTIKREFSEALDLMEEQHDEVWSKTYEELNLDPSGTYRANAKDGVIYEMVDEDDMEDDPFTQFVKKKRGNLH